MGEWRECKNCYNDEADHMIYLCKADNLIFCEECGIRTPNIHGNINCICPSCESVSDARVLGEIDPSAYEGDNKCENCGNVDGSDMLYLCKNDDLHFCQQCGDKVFNILGNHNCICPICHSTSDVKILGEIDGDTRAENDSVNFDDISDQDDNIRLKREEGEDKDLKNDIGASQYGTKDVDYSNSDYSYSPESSNSKKSDSKFNPATIILVCIGVVLGGAVVFWLISNWQIIVAIIVVCMVLGSLLKG